MRAAGEAQLVYFETVLATQKSAYEFVVDPTLVESVETYRGVVGFAVVIRLVVRSHARTTYEIALATCEYLQWSAETAHEREHPHHRYRYGKQEQQIVQIVVRNR